MTRYRERNDELEDEHISDPSSPGSNNGNLRRLRRENAILRQERDFLKKATAYFANPPE